MARKYREEFDGEREFVAKKHLVQGGNHLAPGQPIDKAKTNLRRLRQLYDQHQIEMAPLSQPVEPERKAYGKVSQEQALQVSSPSPEAEPQEAESPKKGKVKRVVIGGSPA